MTIEYGLQHADWIATNVPSEKRSVNDKVVLNLAAEVRRLRSERDVWQRRSETVINGSQPLTTEQVAYGRDVVAPRINTQVIERLAEQLYLAQMTALIPSSAWPQRGWNTLTEDQREGWRVVVAAAQESKP